MNVMSRSVEPLRGRIDHETLLRIYEGSNGEATSALYARLETLGPTGVVAVNLFRAMKCSARAKVYRGGAPGKGSYRRMAYDRKRWSIENLSAALDKNAGELGIVWGWGVDNCQAVHRHVLYIDLPTGQVSFHTDMRSDGPHHAKGWDGVRGASVGRLLDWIAGLFAETPA